MGECLVHVGNSVDLMPSSDEDPGNQDPDGGFVIDDENPTRGLRCWRWKGWW